MEKHSALSALNESSESESASPLPKTVWDEIANGLVELVNASYGELRSSVETNKEYTPAPNEPCINKGDPNMKHFKNWATSEEWAVAERVSGWFQQRIAAIIDKLGVTRDRSTLPTSWLVYRDKILEEAAEVADRVWREAKAYPFRDAGQVIAQGRQGAAKEIADTIRAKQSDTDEVAFDGTPLALPTAEVDITLETVLWAAANFISCAPDHRPPKDREAVLAGLTWAMERYTAPSAEVDKATPLKDDIQPWLTEQCSRLMYGQCTTARCVKRGGWTGGGYDPAIATCEAYEVTNALAAVNAYQPRSAEVTLACTECPYIFTSAEIAAEDKNTWGHPCHGVKSEPGTVCESFRRPVSDTLRVSRGKAAIEGVMNAPTPD